MARAINVSASLGALGPAPEQIGSTQLETLSMKGRVHGTNNAPSSATSPACWQRPQEHKSYDTLRTLSTKFQSAKASAGLMLDTGKIRGDIQG